MSWSWPEARRRFWCWPGPGGTWAPTGKPARSATPTSDSHEREATADPADRRLAEYSDRSLTSGCHLPLRPPNVQGSNPAPVGEWVETAPAVATHSANAENTPRSNCDAGLRWPRWCVLGNAGPNTPTSPELGEQHAGRWAIEGRRSANRRRYPGKPPAKSSGLRSQAEGVLLGAEEAVLAGDFLGEGRDEAFAIDGDAKGGLNACEQFGDMQRRASFLEYVIGHVHLRPTFS